MKQAGTALRYRDYRLFWTGALVSNIGTWMQNITVPYVLYHLTGRAVYVGWAVVAQILPSIVLNPLSGSLADRFSRRGQLRVSNGIQALTAIGLWLVWATGLQSALAVLLLVAVGGTASMATQPAWQALVPDLVPDEHRMNAITLNSAQANSARAVGPALGGVVLGVSWLGPSVAFLSNAVSFLAVIVVLTMIRSPDRHAGRLEGRVWTQFREAATYARGHAGLVTAYASTALVCGLANPVFQMVVVFAKRVYHVGPGPYGVLTAVYGIGAVAGAVVLGAAASTRSRAGILRASFAVQAVTMVLLGLAPNIWLGAPVLAVLGAGTLASIATLNTSIQLAAPDVLRGRVLALWILSYTVTYPAGSLLQGALADRIGPGWAVGLAGVALGLGGLALARRMSSLDDYGPDPCPTSPTATTRPAAASPASSAAAT